MLRPEFVRRKLHLIAEELSRLVELKDESYVSLTDSPLKLAALERYIERIVGRAIDVNEHLISALSDGSEDKITRLTYRETFLRLPDYGIFPSSFAEEVARSAGLRNVILHEYNDVDRRILYDAIGLSLEQYRRYVEYVSDFLDARDEG